MKGKLDKVFDLWLNFFLISGMILTTVMIIALLIFVFVIIPYWLLFPAAPGC